MYEIFEMYHIISFTFYQIYAGAYTPATCVVSHGPWPTRLKARAAACPIKALVTDYVLLLACYLASPANMVLGSFAEICWPAARVQRYNGPVRTQRLRYGCDRCFFPTRPTIPALQYSNWQDVSLNWRRKNITLPWKAAYQTMK